MKRIIAVWIMLVAVLAGMGCKKNAIAVHPGAVSNLDSYAYDILLVEQDVINEAKAQYSAGNFPQEAVGPLRNAITQYNVSQAAWHAYHEKHTTDTTVLQDAINSLIAAVSQLQQSLGKTLAKPSADLVIAPEWRFA